MKGKTTQIIILLLAGSAFASIPFFFSEASASFQQQEFWKPKAADLAEMAKELKEAGRYEAVFTTLVTLPHYEDYDQLQDHSDAVVVGTLLSYRYRPTADRGSVETIYRFQLEEIVSGSMIPPDPAAPPPEPTRFPASVPGLPGFRTPSDNEILVQRSGGILRIDGVLFRFETGYPLFSVGSQYILFLKHTSPRRQDGYYGDSRFSMMSPLAGPYGCIEVTERGDGQLQSQAEHFDSLLRDRFGRDKVLLLNKLRDRGLRPN